MNLRSFAWVVAWVSVCARTSPATDFKGRVLMPDGSPAGTGMVVRAGPMNAAPGAPPAATATVDPDGRFALGVAGAGLELWIADAAGRARIGWPHLDVSRDFGDIRLPADGSLGGQVVGPDGKTVRGVRVVLLRRLDARCSHYVESGSTTSGDDGSFLFEPFPRGDHACRIDSDEFAPAWHEIRVGSDSYLEIHLKKAAVLAGHVVGPAGPVAGVEVTVSGKRGPVRTDAAGAFVVRGLDVGSYILGVRSSGWTTLPKTRLRFAAPSGETVTCRVDVVRGGSVRVALKPLDPAVRLPDRMTFEMGRAGARFLMPELYDLEADLTNGVALLRDLPPGTYELKPEGSEWGPVSTQVVVVAERETEAVLALPKTRTLSVLVVDAVGKPVEDASVRTVVKRPGAEDDSSSAYLRTDENGRAEWPGLTEGRVTVEIDDEKNLPEKREWDVATLAGEQKIVLRAGFTWKGVVSDVAGRLLDGVKVSVRVTAPATNPAPGSTAGAVETIPEDPFGSNDLARRETKTVAGRFEFTGLAAGKARIAIESEDHEPLAEEFDLGLATSGRTFRLRRGEVIAGRVVEGGNAPTEELDVTVNGPAVWVDDQVLPFGFITRTAKPGPDGSFRIAGLPKGTYQLSVDRPESRMEPEAELEDVAAGSTNVLVELGRMVAVPVLVLGPDGRPVSGATLSGYKLEQGRSGRYVIHSSFDGADETPMTDVQGRGAVRARQGGRLAVMASKPPWIDGRAVVDIGRGPPATNVVLRLTAGLRLEGRVLDAAGRPAAGRRIRSSPSPASAVSGDDDTGPATDAEGRFRLEGLPAGPVRVAAFARGDEDDIHRTLAMTTVVVRRDGPVARVELRLPAVGAVRGTVLRTNGAPASGACVTLIPVGGMDEQRSPMVSADADGKFSVEDVPAGDYRVMWTNKDVAGVDESSPLFVPLTVKAGQTAQVVCRVEAEHRPLRKGRVLVAGRPSAGAQVTFLPEPPEDYESNPASRAMYEGLCFKSGRAKTDANGRFEVRLAQPGRYVVTADTEGKRRTRVWYAARMELGAAGDLDLRFEGASLRGVLRDAEGRPRAGVPVALVPDDGNLRVRQMLYLERESGTDGVFEFDAVPPGTYTLRSSDDRGYAIRSGVVVGGQDVTADLRTRPGVRVQGSVRLEGGEAAEWAEVIAVSRGSVYDSGCQGVDEEGQYDFTPPLPAGRYQMLAWLDGYAVKCRDVDVQKEVVLDWTLAEGGSLDVRLEGTENKRGGRELHLFGADGREVMRPRGTFTPCPPGVALRPTNAEGRTRIVGLLPGKYEVRMEGSSARASAEVKPGAVSEVHIAIE